MANNVYKIWNDIKPFSRKEDADLHEHVKENATHDGIDRYTDVTEPELHFFPALGSGLHPAMLVCPGGAYAHLAWNKEGINTAYFLNLQGISAFVLKYRCPDRRQAARADAARAMRFIRSNAEHFWIKPNCVGVIGYSAGAHLATTLSAPADPVHYPETDQIDKESSRPDFAMLIYPAYLINEEKRIADEFKPDAQTPPTFLVQTEDDPIMVENSLVWYAALKRAGVPAEMHLYADGGHGYGMLHNGNPVSKWDSLAAEWLQTIIQHQ